MCTLWCPGTYVLCDVDIYPVLSFTVMSCQYIPYQPTPINTFSQHPLSTPPTNPSYQPTSTGPNSIAGSQRSGNSDNLSFHSLASMSQPGTIPSQEGIILSLSLSLTYPYFPILVITITHAIGTPNQYTLSPLPRCITLPLPIPPAF